MDITKELKPYIKKNEIIDQKIFDFIEENIQEIINKVTNTKILAIIINYAKDKYFNDQPVLSDYAYDLLIDRLTELDPENKVLTEVGYKISSINKVELPYHMGSMTKVKLTSSGKETDTIEILNKWKNKFKGPFIVSDKLDGISAMLIVNKNNKVNLYTRGDGTIGSDISHIVQYLNINNLENIKKYINTNNLDRIVLRGEIIMPIKIFYNKYKNVGANPRNFVSGQVNAKDIKGSILKDINLVFYEVIEPWTTIDMQYNIITTLQLAVSQFELLTYDKLNVQNLSNELKKRKNSSIYEIDGIIISDVGLYARNKTGNPEYSIAFKETLESNIVDATVEMVEWNISKDGYLKPRIKIIPINIGGVQITYATAHNAKYVFDNKIGPGAIIKITRSGDVIPYIVSVVRPVSNPQMPSKALGNWEWNKTGVDIVLIKFTDEQLIKILAYFTKGLGIKNIDEATFKTLVDNKLITKLELDGFQERKATKILEELDGGFKRMHLVDLMYASNIFGHGFGERKLKKIMIVYPDIILQSYKPANKLVEMIDNIEGFDEISSRQFVASLDDFIDFLEDVPKNIKDRLMLDTIPKLKPKHKVNLNGLKIVFTGFRNKDWEKMIVDANGEISNSVSKNTGLLVCEDPDENSNKINKAKELNIPIIKRADFEDYMKQKYKLKLIDL